MSKQKETFGFDEVTGDKPSLRKRLLKTAWYLFVAYIFTCGLVYNYNFIISKIIE